MTAFSRFLFAPRQGFSTFMSPLQLWPLYIAGMTRPVTDADGGINIAVVEEHDGGVLTVLDPYPDMAAGDAISIFVADEPVHQVRVTPDDLDKRLMFYLPVAKFIPGTLECHYVLTRAGETAPDDPSVRLKLRVKLDNPAGGDKEPHKPGHSELKMVGLPQDVIDNGVSKEWATQGVPMTVARYPGITLRDHIYVKWGNVFLLPHEVTQAEVDGAEIIITATPADILSGGDSNKLLIHYQVYDEVWNFSEKWSQQANVAVEAGASRLEPAIFKEADEGQIQLKDLDHQPATLLIHIQSGGVFEAGDTVKIRIIGTPIPGSPSRTFTAEVILRTPAYVLEQSIPYEFVSLFAMGTLDASYELHKKNCDRHSSKRTWASVIGNPSQLPAPAINEVIGATLPADSPLATVLIRYPSMVNGDFINLIWEGIRSNGNPYVHEEQHSVSDNEQREGLVTVYVASEHIQALANGSLKLYYRVATDVEDDDGVSESDYLRVEVGTLRATLPPPEVEEAVDGIIDPSQANTQVHVRIKPVAWAKGDTLTYYWIGTSPLVSTQDSLPITELGIGEPRRFRVAARFVSGNIGHIVTVRYTLRHAATGKFSYSLPLSVMIGEPVGFFAATRSGASARRHSGSDEGH